MIQLIEKEQSEIILDEDVKYCVVSEDDFYSHDDLKEYAIDMLLDENYEFTMHLLKILNGDSKGKEIDM